MARFLVLDWDHQQLNVVLATLRRGRVRIDKAISLTETQSPNPADAEALGQLLRERLKTADIAAAPVLACVGRDRVILKDIRHPPVPPTEEPAVVRFQVLKELTDPPDEVVIDYTPTGEAEASGERRALALILRRELLTTYQHLCHAAGLKLAGLCPRPFGTIACLKQVLSVSESVPKPEPPDAAIGVLTAGKTWAEFCVVHGGHVLFARSLAAGATLAADVRRNLAVYAGQAPEQPIRAVYVAGGAESADLCERLQELARVPVHSFDPFAGVIAGEVPVESRGAFSGAIGLLHAQAARGALPINFAQPKQPRPPRDPNRRRIAFAAAAAGVLLLVAVAYCYMQLDARDRELNALFDEKTDLERQAAKMEEDSKQVKALDDWTGGEIVWLDELYDLTDRFPDPNTLRLTQLTGDPMAQTGKSPYVARMMLKGIMTNDYQVVNRLETQLVNDNHYRVEPKVVARNTGADRFRFPQQFTTRAEIEKLLPEKYLRRLPDPPRESVSSKRRQSGDDASGASGFDGFGGGQP